jgi:hypothetical protein
MSKAFPKWEQLTMLIADRCKKLFRKSLPLTNTPAYLAEENNFI